jgi:hypothetical protein
MEPKKGFTDKKGILVARALVNASGGSVPVQLAGMGEKEMTLRKGTRVGELAALDNEVLTVLNGGGGRAEKEGSVGKQRQKISRENFEKKFDWDGSTLKEAERTTMMDLLWEFKDSFALEEETWDRRT